MGAKSPRLVVIRLLARAKFPGPLWLGYLVPIVEGRAIPGAVGLRGKLNLLQPQLGARFPLALLNSRQSAWTCWLLSRSSFLRERLPLRSFT